MRCFLWRVAHSFLWRASYFLTNYIIFRHLGCTWIAVHKQYTWNVVQALETGACIGGARTRGVILIQIMEYRIP